MVPPFASEVRPILSFLALCAERSATSRVAEVFFHAFLSSFWVAEENTTLGALGEASGFDDAYHYTEVRILAAIHHIRQSLRALEDLCGAHRSFVYQLLLQYVEDLYSIIPDPVFSALLLTLSALKTDYDRLLHCDLEKAPPQTLAEHEKVHRLMRVIEDQLRRSVEILQEELLKETKNLTQRASQLRFHFDFVFPS